MLIDRSEPQEGATGIQCVGCGCDKGLCGCDKETSRDLVTFEIVRIDYDKDDWLSKTPLLVIRENISTGDITLYKTIQFTPREMTTETLAENIGKIYGVTVGPDLIEICQVLSANLERLKNVPFNYEDDIFLPAHGAQYLEATLGVRNYVTLRIYGSVEKGLRHLVERFIAELREFEAAGGTY